MDEATCKKTRRFLPNLRSQRGQAFVEYILVLSISLLFLRIVYFNQEFGFKALLDKSMLRLGSFLELNLKTGTQAGAGGGEEGSNSLDAYSDVSQWSN